MVITAESTKLIFDTLPLSFLTLTETLFQDFQHSVALLPLHTIEQQPATNTLQQWLHKDEQTQLTKFKFEKRYREWLGGRICAKQSLRIFLRSSTQSAPFIPEHAQCRVLSEESGKPYFGAMDEIEFNFPELSISHSKGYAAAMINSSPCGIDIQFSAENLIRVQDRFCNNGEGHLMHQALPLLPDLSKLTLLWSAKEAAKKMLSPGGIPGFQELHLCRVEPQNKNDVILYFSVKRTESPIPVTATMMDNNYAVAICCEVLPQTGTE